MGPPVPKRGTDVDPIILIDYAPEYSFPRDQIGFRQKNLHIWSRVKANELDRPDHGFIPYGELSFKKCPSGLVPQSGTKKCICSWTISHSLIFFTKI